MEKMITASFEHLHADGMWVADGYLRAAVEAVEKQFGANFVKNNPAAAASIIAAYMTAASTSYAASSRSKVLEGVAAGICSSLDSVAAAISEVAIELRQNGG